MKTKLMDDVIDLPVWIRLVQTAGVGPQMACRLMKVFGVPQHIFTASFADLRTVVSERVARMLLAEPSDTVRALIETTLEWVEQSGNRILTLADADYPQALLQIADPPILLYVKGRSALLSSPALAVVGSRNATVQGVRNSEQFAEAASQAGLTIVSGLALGIDAAAHQGGLRGSGSTVAVIGTGADIVYPVRNRQLAQQIMESGCIVSEYALGMPAIASHFPRRNRIISGLARAVLVVEAAAQSGSLITARMAAEQGRDVFAIPGSIHSSLSKGCHQLIKQGAKLVESVGDMLEELGDLPLPSMRAMHCRIDASADIVLQIMGFDPISSDILCVRCGLDAATLSARLLALELDGAVERLPGTMYRRLI